MKVERLFSIVLISIFVIAIPALVHPVFGADQPIKLRVLSSWSSDYPYVRAFVIPYVNRLNEKSAGRLQASWVGPEAIPPFEQLKPLSAGLFEMLFTTPSYHMNEIALGMGMDTVKATPKQRRAAGFYELLNEAYGKLNAKVLGMAFGEGTGFHFMLKKEIKKADFTGLKIRTVVTYEPLVKALNGASVRVPAPEIYSSLEKGVVDGAAWPSMGALDYKWYEVAHFQLRPQFGQCVEDIIINLDTWKRLPKDLQNLITEVTIETEEEAYRTLTAAQKEEEEKLVKLGMKLNVLPPSEGERLENLFYATTWKEIILKSNPEFGPRLKLLADKFIKTSKTP